SGRGVFTKAFEPFLFEVEHITPPVPGKEKVAIQQLKDAIGKGGRKRTMHHQPRAACFIFEPLVLGAGGMLMYKPQPLDEMISICRKNNVLTIADEVMTGFGRTGKLFATGHLRNHPDIICLSKGITGGFLPLGLTACTESIFQAFGSDDRSKTFFHGHSYTANPLACAAADASLDLIEKKKFMADIRRIHARHLAFIKKIERHPRVQNPRVTGTIFAFDFQTTANSRQSSYFHPARNLIYDFFIERGILLRPLGNTIYVMPPYCITNEELKAVYEAIRELLEKVALVSHH
ncbi:MAG TPA: aminotransferase class III-fold pyridoxal phosphate-dependent enzyme, partial [Chitinophagales bacterium]|nr:aminotransferase class III-fold pyridoxal phosphate-dependent enzyme [Chitinophagales bacterium]